ncbi:MAG: HAD family phosphatase [Bacteroidales bacterium]|nr:HAD family phosphatase [Bacteroidales bacterium]MBN2749185.1 HAD family phosphatase [Bacteroidales bacterium]
MQQLLFTPLKGLQIRNIIFDLGGVILNIDYHLTINAFKDLGFQSFDQTFTQAAQVDLFDNLDTGTITPQQFRDGVKSLTSAPITDEQIDHAWNAMLLDFPVHRLELLAEVKKRYRTFLLSNTNQIHIDVYNQILKNTFGVDNLSPFFEREYYSHEIHRRKPHPSTFEFVLEQNGLKPEETLFIDDTLQHVEGARKAGLHAYHLKVTEGESIEQLFCLA